MTAVPVREAIIVPEGGDPLRRVARVPLLVRTILALQRAGVERCTLVRPLEPPADPRIHCTLASAPALAPAGDPALRLVVGSATVIDETLVRELQARARPGETLEAHAGGACARVAPGPLVGADGGARVEPVAGTLRPAGGWDVEETLLRALENPRDGYLDRVVHRRMSRSLTRLLLRTSVSPNVVTVVGLLLGATGGLALGVSGAGAVLIAVLLLGASAVLDCTDGELARVSHAQSRLGHWLDLAGDTIVHVAVLAGIATRLATAGAAPGWPVLGLLAMGVAGAFVVITWSEATETRRHRVRAWENTVLDGVLSPLSTRDWYVFPLAFAVLGRLDLLVPAAAVGAQVFWIATLVLLRRVLRRADG